MRLFAHMKFPSGPPRTYYPTQRCVVRLKAIKAIVFKADIPIDWERLRDDGV